MEKWKAEVLIEQNSMVNEAKICRLFGDCITKVCEIIESNEFSEKNSSNYNFYNWKCQS